MSKIKLIIDTDPGVDDTLAIMSAIKSKNIDLLGLTTVYGNSDIENTTKNALTINQILKTNIPVFQGAFDPICGKSKLAKCHGENGLGGYQLENLNLQKRSENAIDFLISTLSINPNKSITVAVIGPATNIAILKSLRPDLFNKIKQLIIMAGVFDGPGNVTAVAEFNAYNDPFALRSILNTQVDTILIPANICRQVTFSKDDLKESSKEVQEITDNYIKYYLKDKVFGGFSGGVMYDVLTIAYLHLSSFFDLELFNIFVDTREGVSFGQTIKEKDSAEYKTKLVTNLKTYEIKKWFLKTIK
jgi:purine nucleosidase